jgi:DNA polymerase V
MSYFALVDCNNFYASCERLFQPQLLHTPIVVLSNNDGCVIARSNEAKALGIPMGEPFFKIRRLVDAGKVKVFSSNFALYGDLSRRVMEVLASFCDELEVYSIDEAFMRFDFAGQTEASSLKLAARVRAKVGMGVGIPVCVGIAVTKTLAKMANHIAKKRTETGVYLLHPGAAVLQEIGVGEVWGVGRAYERRLGEVGIRTVADLATVDQRWIRAEFGVVGLRLVKELNGEVCQDLEPPVAGRKNTMVSRSFADDVYELAEVERRLALYATRLGEKLRQYDQAATTLTVSLWANRFKNRRKDGRTYFAQTIELPQATNHTNRLIEWSRKLGGVLFEKGTNYKKAGIMAGALVPSGGIQSNLFTDQRAEARNDKLMAALDAINQVQGKGAVRFSGCGGGTGIPLRQEFRSSRYTTEWEEILGI